MDEVDVLMSVRRVSKAGRYRSVFDSCGRSVLNQREPDVVAQHTLRRSTSISSSFLSWRSSSDYGISINDRVEGGRKTNVRDPPALSRPSASVWHRWTQAVPSSSALGPQKALESTMSGRASLSAMRMGRREDE